MRRSEKGKNYPGTYSGAVQSFSHVFRQSEWNDLASSPLFGYNINNHF